MVLAGLLAGIVVVAGGGDGDEGVVVGPVGGDEAAPPPTEPTDGMVTMALTAGPVVDGLPTLEPGRRVMATYQGLVELFGRERRASWQRWDGSAWIEERYLIGNAGYSGWGGEVTPTAPPPTVPDDLVTGAGPDPFPTPDDAEPGWYRICVTMRGLGAGTVAGTTMPGDPEDAVPTETRIADDHRIVACGQLRVVPDTGEADPPEGAAEETTTTTAPPPESEVELPVRLDFGPELSPGGLVFGDFVWDEGASGSRADVGTWEAWDGETWTVTHRTTITGFDSVPEIAPWAGTNHSPAPTMVPAEGRVAFLTPPATEAPPGIYRLCLPVQIDGEPDRQPLCEQITLTEPDLVPGYPDREGATWAIDPDDPPEPTDQVVTVLVTRVRCTDGEAGPLLEPEVRANEGSVHISFSADPGTGDCPDGPERREVDLGAPLGDRLLMDQICFQNSELIDACGETSVRWGEP